MQLQGTTQAPMMRFCVYLSFFLPPSRARRKGPAPPVLGNLALISNTIQRRAELPRTGGSGAHSGPTFQTVHRTLLVSGAFEQCEFCRRGPCRERRGFVQSSWSHMRNATACFPDGLYPAAQRLATKCDLIMRVLTVSLAGETARAVVRGGEGPSLWEERQIGCSGAK